MLLNFETWGGMGLGADAWGILTVNELKYVKL